jgi:dihydroorotase
MLKLNALRPEGLDLSASKFVEVPERIAKRFQLSKGRLQAGSMADITIVDLEKTTAIDPDQFASKGKNTPFTGWECQGWPVMTIVSGQIVWSEEQGFIYSQHKGGDSHG